MEEVIEKAEQNFEDLLVKTGNVPLIEAYTELKQHLYNALVAGNEVLIALQSKIPPQDVH